MRRWLFQNMGLKFLSLLIAFALWAYVGSRQVLEQRLNLHLEFADIPAGMTLDPNVRTTVSVNLTGRKDRILDIDPEDLKAVVSLRNAQPGQKELLVHPKVQPLPFGVSANVPDLTLKLIPLVDNSTKSKKKRGSI
jgi:YbbR domain-containing protein